MISEAAQGSLDRLFKSAITRHVQERLEQGCHIGTVIERTEINAQEFALMTLSSSVFKCLGVFYLNENEEALRSFHRMSSTTLESFGKLEFRDAFLEFCNLCFGTLNRDLHQYFPYLGMSTPYFLQQESAQFFHTLKPGFSKDYRIIIDSRLTLYASLHVCDYGGVDFTASYADTNEDTGALELF